MTRLPENICLRCGVACHGKVCRDCRETDPAWFALAGLYHAKNQRPSTGKSA